MIKHALQQLDEITNDFCEDSLEELDRIDGRFEMICLAIKAHINTLEPSSPEAAEIKAQVDERVAAFAGKVRSLMESVELDAETVAHLQDIGKKLKEAARRRL